MYLDQCSKESKSDDDIDIKVYTQLVALDTKLGISAEEQLFECVYNTLRMDLIKV